MSKKTQEGAERAVHFAIGDETEQELADFLNTVNVGLHCVGPDGTILQANQTALDLLGYSRDEYVGHPISRFHVDQQGIADFLKRLSAEEGLNQYPAQMRCRDGSLKDVLINSTALRRNNRLVHTRCYTLDVTARRKAEAQQDLLASIVTSTDDAVISLTLDGEVTFWNAGAEHLYGYSAAEAIGRPIAFIIPVDKHEEHLSILERLRRGDRVQHFETTRITKAGLAVDISLTVSVICRSDGRVIGASKVARDISARKQAERAARAARKALEEADRRKDHFLAMLAHELRNPLAPLRNSLEMLKRAPRDAAVVEAARDMMDRQVSHFERLVDDLLDVARINEDQLQLRKSEVDLASVLNHVAEVFRPLAEGSKVQLAVAVPGEPIYLDADPVRITQIFNNLLSNAFKYTPAEGNISVVAQVQGPCVTVSIKDTGLGIPADMLERVFEMFIRVERPGQNFQGGLGIGLSLARRLVRMHGGTVKAFSGGANSGSEFVVTFPLSSQTHEPHSLGRALVDPRAVRRKVLIVDDNLDAAESLAILMKMAGHDVRMAFDGIDAIKTAETFQPNIVFLDIGLPKLSGSEVARRIRQQPWSKGMILVAVTGWGQEEDRRNSRAVGFDHHLVKPAKLEDLSKIIDGLPVQLSD